MRFGPIQPLDPRDGARMANEWDGRLGVCWKVGSWTNLLKLQYAKRPLQEVHDETLTVLPRVQNRRYDYGGGGVGRMVAGLERSSNTTWCAPAYPHYRMTMSTRVGTIGLHGES